MGSDNDRREGLREGTCLPVGGGRRITVGREIGRGAVSIVYDGICVDRIGVQHRVRIRECCPDGLSFKRDREGALIVSPADQLRFEEAMRRFRESYRRNVRMRNQPGLVNSTVNAGDLIEGNQTCYAVMTFDEGTDYRIYQDASLKELFGHIRSLAELIGRYHENGYLHLDIKPENVLVIPETEEHVLLFDFDSVVTMEELREDPSLRLTYSEGFSAPEQRQGRRGRIGCHTDIYSIGALAFYKIFGRRPAADDGRLSAVYDFSGMRYADRRYPPKLYREMAGFFRKCLSVSTVSRWEHMAPVLETLEELIRLSDVERRFVYDSFQYNSGCFIGREEELQRLHETLQERQLVFLSGLGGIGKTEIAKRYAQTYRQEYGTIVYTIYGTSVEELVNQEILVNGMEQGEEESSREYFERKLHAMREALTPDDLLILDNFDVDQDEDLELLFTCPCRFIITTREDFRDYGYPQLEIDRMESMDEILQLFDAYNDCDYTGPERDAVRQILTLVDGHTMTVELIAKYLRDTGERPEELYQRFLEKEGTANTEEIRIRQRKDRSLRAKSVNDHIRILFDMSCFSPMEEELIRSLSLLGSIRIARRRFLELCRTGSDSKELELLIRRGWIEHNEENDKIALHQIIQDLVYNDLKPDAENCPRLVESMIDYWNAKMANDSEMRVRERVFRIFMERLSGSSLTYAGLCADYGEEQYLDGAEDICRKSTERRALDILQKIYRKKIENTAAYEDIPDAGVDWDDYYRYKFQKIAELLDKTMECCRRCSDSPDDLARICTETGIWMDGLLTNDFAGTAAGGRIEELDRIYEKIMDILDLATDNILRSGLEDPEKEDLLMRIRDFYTDNNVMALYRCEYFLDLEKAHWYQEQIERFAKRIEEDEEGRIVGIDMYSVGMSDRSIAGIYEERENYDNAIQYYKKAYEDPEEPGRLILYDLARVCRKAGYTDQAEVYFGHILELDREEGGYSSEACIELIRLLVSEDRVGEAEELAQELLDYNRSRIQTEEHADAILGMTEACYWLFTVEEDPERKKDLWENAVRYYRMLDPEEGLTDDLLEFLSEYIGSMEISEEWFEEALDLLKRADRQQGRQVIRNIYERVLGRCGQEENCGEWYVVFLLLYADYLSSLEQQQYTEALHYCETAWQYYDLHQMQDSYIQNQIYRILAECMNNLRDFDDDEVQQIREKCDYALLAQRETESGDCSDEERYEAWKRAADKYGLADCYERERYCIQKAMDVILPVLGQHAYSSYSNYCFLARDRIRCSMHLDDREQTRILIDEMYNRLLNGRKEFAQEDILDWGWWNNSLADDLEDLGYRAEAANLYLYILYVSVSPHPDHHLIENLCLDQHRDKILYEELDAAIKGELTDDAINQIVGLKEKILSLLEPWEAKKRYVDLLQWFSEHYEHREIEFKR